MVSFMTKERQLHKALKKLDDGNKVASGTGGEVVTSLYQGFCVAKVALFVWLHDFVIA